MIPTCFGHQADPALQKEKRFTLIEMLVVIAIISILMAMLLPALKGVRDMAKTTLCVSNQKQVAQLFLNYADSFDGYVPLSRMDMAVWITFLINAGMADVANSPTPGHNPNYPIFGCPIAPPLSTEGWAGGANGYASASYYDIPGHCTADQGYDWYYSAYGTWGCYPTMIIHRIRNSSYQPLLVDSVDHAVYTQYDWLNGSYDVIHLRHNKTACMAFADGSARTQKESDIVGDLKCPRCSGLPGAGYYLIGPWSPW